MNKTLALIALLGLVSAPAFANEAAAPAVKAEKVVAKDGKAEAAKEGEAKAEEAAAPAADAAAKPAEKK